MSLCMSGLFFYLAVATCFVVLAVLIFGVATFARGGEFNRKYSNKIMRVRLAVQAVAVVLILLAVALARLGE
ncbi:MAG: twin transmembrane helix small protein [Pseudomonadota bacterium]